MNDCLIIIFGATGDLAIRKLIPACIDLIKRNKTSNLYLIAAAKDTLSKEEFVEKIKIKTDEESQQIFKNNVSYFQADFTNLKSINALKENINLLGQKLNLPQNRLAYLSVASNIYAKLTENLFESGLLLKTLPSDNFFHRIIYEKPFGSDLKSAKTINRKIKKYFDETSIYRIDHYLSKPLVSNITLLRFCNTFFEPLWNKKYIESIKIELKEKVGVENRAYFYEQFGALKDVVQNHLMQILALLAISKPINLNPENISREKLKILKKAKVKNYLLGQYEGYNHEKGVAPNSNTETFAALEMEINTPQFKGLPFYLVTGKKLNEKKAEIKITFKSGFQFEEYCTGCTQNALIINISPEGGFKIILNGLDYEKNKVMELSLDFCYKCQFGPEYIHTYEVILKAAVEGDRSITVSPEEIEASWKIIDELEKTKELKIYSQSSEGPEVPFIK